MERKYLILIPFFTGLTLLIYSWYLSFPLSIKSANDFIFYNISFLYWFGLSLLLASTFLIALSFKNRYLKWILSIVFLLTLYSLTFFYVSVPNSDSQAFRGLNEYFISTGNLDPAVRNHAYYQWPLYFILTKIVTSVSGLPLIGFEFLLYGTIGFLFATCLYIYASKKFVEGGFVMVAAFFVVMTYFFNYQAVPFSLAFGILLLIFILDTCQKSNEIWLTMFILYTSLLFTHAFVPLFFVLYLLVRGILDKSRVYVNLFVLALVSYVIVQLTFGRLAFADNILSVMTKTAEYASMIKVTFSSIQVQPQIDTIAQFFSRFVTVIFLTVSGIGFALMVIKRKINSIDRAILITGIIYSGLGIFLYTLGTRAISLIFIPVALGTAYLLERKNRKLRKYLILILLTFIVLFTFVPIHQSFGNEIQFQTTETYVAQNFFIQNYDWHIGDSMLMTYRVSMYLDSKVSSYINYADSVHNAKIIFYTDGLGKDLGNYTSDYLNQEQRLSVVYDNGFSYIGIKTYK